MAGTLFWVDAIQVFVGAEDHPPPHVHAVHSGEGWVARFRFSFLSDVTGLYRFRRRGRRPTTATLDRVAEAIMANLPAWGRRPNDAKTYGSGLHAMLWVEVGVAANP